MVLQKKMVAKFDEQGAHTVPFQQCIDSEVQILRRWVLELFRSSLVGRLQDLAPACGAVAGGRGMTRHDFLKLQSTRESCKSS